MTARIPRRAFTASLALGVSATLLGVPMGTQAQPAYPSQTIKFIVPYPAGGATDIVARVIAEKLQASFGQNVVIENKPGAGGIIGAQHVTRAPADGHTVLIGVTALIQQPAMLDKLPYDPLKDLAPAVLTARTSNLFIVPKASPAQDFKQFVALAKASPGKYNYGSWGNGSSAHIHGELINQQTGADLLHVPFQGSAPMITHLLGGQITAGIIDIPSARSYFHAVRVLAVTGPQRIPELPNVPTFTELGYKNFEPRGWHGMFMPGATPAAVVRKFSDEVNRILKLPEVSAKIESLGMLVGGGTPEEYAATMRTDAKVYADIIKAANIKLAQ